MHGTAQQGGTDVLQAYWQSAGFLESDVAQIGLRDTIKVRPPFFDSAKVKYTGPIIIRTEASRREVANY